MKITYTVGSRAGLTAEVDTETGTWMVAKRRAIAVQDTPSEGDGEPRVKRKYTRRAPTTGKGEDKGTED